MRVTIEPPEHGAWASTRTLIMRLEQLGYVVTKYRGAVRELEIR